MTQPKTVHLHPVPRPRRLVELLLLYLIAPGLLALVTAGHRWLVLVSIVGGSILSFALLWFDPTWPRGEFVGREGLRRELGPALLRCCLLPLLLLGLLWAAGRWPEFRLPRERTAVWLGVLAIYPLLSALPQEVMFRALFFHRYGDLFRTQTARIAASAVLFGWAHLLVHNALAMLLATAAGALLSITWVRSRSVLLVGLEHSLYGAFILSAGIGGMFVNGVRIVSSFLR